MSILVEMQSRPEDLFFSRFPMSEIISKEVVGFRVIIVVCVEKFFNLTDC